MANKKRERKKKRRSPLVPLAAAAALILALVVLGTFFGQETQTDVTQAGIAYLESLEQKDPNAVSQVLRARRQAELEAQREELLRQVKAGELDPFTLFQDAVILGDSRAVGFSYYGYVDENRTMTGTGDTILSLNRQIDALVSMNPQYIYLCYGLNDIKIGHWASVEAHIADYISYVNKIRQQLPDTVVVISSVLPYYDQTGSDDPTAESVPQATGDLTAADLKRLAQIPAWNEAMAKACDEFGIIFVDNSGICEEHRDLWEPDGIHVKTSFYPYWGKNLVVAALEEGGVHDEEAPV